MTSRNFREFFLALTRWHEWNFIVPLVLVPVFYIFISGSNAVHPLLFSITTFWSFSCCAVFTFLINDFSDREVDLKAHKVKPTASLSKVVILSILLFTIIGGIAPIFFLANFIIADATPIYLLLLCYVIGYLYSMPPVRLKERAALGVFAANLLPSIFLTGVILLVTSFDIALMLFFIKLYLFNVRKLIQHQLVDFFNDKRTNVSTIVHNLGIGRVNFLLYKILMPIELLISTAILIVISAMNIKLMLLLLGFGFILVVHWSLMKRYNIINISPVESYMDDYFSLFLPFALLFLLIERDLKNVLLLVMYILIVRREVWQKYIDDIIILKDHFSLRRPDSIKTPPYDKETIKRILEKLPQNIMIRKDIEKYQSYHFTDLDLFWHIKVENKKMYASYIPFSKSEYMLKMKFINFHDVMVGKTNPVKLQYAGEVEIVGAPSNPLQSLDFIRYLSLAYKKTLHSFS